MADLFVYKLDLVGKQHLEEAFEILLDDVRVVSRSVDPGTSSARFMASLKVGSALVERLYVRGGLRWCTRHPVARLVALEA